MPITSTQKIWIWISSSLAILAVAGGIFAWWWTTQRDADNFQPQVVIDGTSVGPQKTPRQPIVYFANWSYQDERTSLVRFEAYLDDLKSWGANTLLTEVPWSAIETSKDNIDPANYEEFDQFMQAAVDRDFKLIIGLDAGIIRGGKDLTQPTYQAPPKWLFEKYPAAKTEDFDGNRYPLVSFAHADALAESYDFMSNAVQHYQEKFGDNVIAYNANYNNELETRYSQEGFRWQDYSDQMVDAYQEWLAEKYGTVAALNKQWGSNLSSFARVQPLRVDKNQQGFEPDVRPSYTDWMQFREDQLVTAISGAAGAIHEAGGNVFLHFGEVLTKIDSIFTAPYDKLAHVAEVIAIDTNHLTGDFQVSDPSVGGFITSYAQGHGPLVIFETSIERMAEPEIGVRRNTIIESSIEWAMSNGSAGLGVANYLSQWDDLFSFQKKVGELVEQRKDFDQKPVALYGSKWTAYGYHGSHDYRNDEGAFDPFQTNVQGTFAALEDAGYPVAVLSDWQIQKGALDSYDILFLPQQIVVPEKTLENILDFHEGGGALVQDVRFAEFSLTGERDEDDLAAIFNLEFETHGTDVRATPVGELADSLGEDLITIGDALLNTNQTSGLFTSTWITPGLGTKTYLERSDGVSRTLAINESQQTAYLGFLPGVLYNQIADDDVKDAIREIFRFVIETLRT